VRLTGFSHGRVPATLAPCTAQLPKRTLYSLFAERSSEAAEIDTSVQPQAQKKASSSEFAGIQECAAEGLPQETYPKNRASRTVRPQVDRRESQKSRFPRGLKPSRNDKGKGLAYE